MRKWSKAPFSSKMSMKFKYGMLRIPPCSMSYVGNTQSGPLPLPAVFSSTFKAR